MIGISTNLAPWVLDDVFAFSEVVNLCRLSKEVSALIFISDFGHYIQHISGFSHSIRHACRPYREIYYKRTSTHLFPLRRCVYSIIC